MAQVVNGITFPDSFTQEQIDEYFKTLNETQATEETKPEETEEDKRGLLLDVPTQAVGGVIDAGKSALRLIEGIGQDAKRLTGVGCFTFGDNASNGIIQYHSYDDVINNNIKLCSRDSSRIRDKTCIISIVLYLIDF